MPAPSIVREKFRVYNMNSEEYKNRLIIKLNCLIAVIKVAIAKIDNAIQSQPSDKLYNVRGNLFKTQMTCEQARDKLMGVSTAVEQKPPREARSIQEYQKFKKKAPISMDEVQATDLDDLINKLQS